MRALRQNEMSFKFSAWRLRHFCFLRVSTLLLRSKRSGSSALSRADSQPPTQERGGAGEPGGKARRPSEQGSSAWGATHGQFWGEGQRSRYLRRRRHHRRLRLHLLLLPLSSTPLHTKYLFPNVSISREASVLAGRVRGLGPGAHRPPLWSHLRAVTKWFWYSLASDRKPEGRGGFEWTASRSNLLGTYGRAGTEDGSQSVLRRIGSLTGSWNRRWSKTGEKGRRPKGMNDHQ